MPRPEWRKDLAGGSIRNAQKRPCMREDFPRLLHNTTISTEFGLSDIFYGMCYNASVRRVVLDSSVVICAFRSQKGASHRLLDFVAGRRLVLLATPALVLEYEDVLKRPEQREVSGLTLAQVDIALAALAAAVEPVEIRFAWRPQLADPGDEMVLDVAVNGRADALVTHNMADFAQAAHGSV